LSICPFLLFREGHCYEKTRCFNSVLIGDGMENFIGKQYKTKKIPSSIEKGNGL
jgi:hypothetical protein